MPSICIFFNTKLLLQYAIKNYATALDTSDTSGNEGDLIENVVEVS